jgi:cytochrome c5
VIRFKAILIGAFVRFLYFYLLIAVFIFINCEKRIVSTCQRVTDKQDKGNLTTFGDIQKDIFNPSCVSCHSGNNPSAGLDLSENVAYDNLINVESNTSDYKRVIPFKSEESYLFLSLDGESAPVMPPSGRLSDAKVDSVAAWIDRGAPEN